MTAVGTGNGGMRFVDEYRSGDLAKSLAEQIARLVEPDRHYKFMEVCGGHTLHLQARRRGPAARRDRAGPRAGLPGLRDPDGPPGRCDLDRGAPRGDLHDLRRHDAGAGDESSLLDAKARGADVRMVYSPLDALKIARENPDREVVFFAIGFETTTPSTALTVKRARVEGVRNFSLFCNHVTIIPAIRAILDSPDLRLDGFIGPGHVSTVIGLRPYRFARDHGKPVVVSGFEPLDVLQGVYDPPPAPRGRSEVENQYSRVVREEGNPLALRAIAETMELRTTFEWRGLGFISQSALKLRQEYADWDAEVRYQIQASGSRTRRRASAARC